MAFVSCEDFDESDVLTEGEKTRIEIKKIAEQQNITVANTDGSVLDVSGTFQPMDNLLSTDITLT